MGIGFPIVGEVSYTYVKGENENKPCNEPCVLLSQKVV